MLDDVSTHPDATIQCHTSNMVLMMNIYADYLVLPTDQSRIAGHYYFTKRMPDYFKVNPTPNGPILT